MKTARVIVTAAAGLLVIIAVLLTGIGGEPEAPRQPVAFDHWQHVTKEDGPGLSCDDCHEHAATSVYATIPNVSTCMLCHESIESDSPEIRKLVAYSERGEQPPWRRVYWIEPSAKVFFSHKPHIRAGVDCASCHGDVSRMRVVRREIRQTMGWCVDCHTQRGGSRDCYACHR